MVRFLAPSAATAAALLIALTGVSAHADQPTPPMPPPADAELVKGAADANARMSVPVFVNGKGPFRFTVDTGSERSVLSRELAEELKLEATPSVLVHGVNGAQLGLLVKVDKLEMGTRKLQNASLPLLERADLGSDGLLGLDALRDQRVVIDLDKSLMRLETSRGIAFEPGDIIVKAKSRRGQLVMVDSSFGSKPVNVILDSGSEATIANGAFRKLVDAKRHEQALKPDDVVEIFSVTGQVGHGARDLAPQLTLSGMIMRQVPVIYADLHTFRQFGFAEEPTVLLGMDVLRAFRRVDVDFGRREVRFGFARDPATPSVALTTGGATRLR